MWMRCGLWIVGAVGLVAAACGSSPATVSPPAAIEQGVGLAVGQPEATPTETLIPTPTPRPSSKSFVLTPFPVVGPPTSLGLPVPAVNASAVLVMDEASGAVLFEQNAEAQLAPASLTKIATAVVALQAGGLERWHDTIATDSRTMTSSTVMGLVSGDYFTLRDLLYGLMLPSGNDAAIEIARKVSGSEAAFVADMNHLAQTLNLQETHFQNPHGLGASNHVTSAYDLAVLTRYAFTVPGFAELAAARSWVARGGRTIAMANLNSLVNSYPGADGVKVGYTRRAGRTLVASATRNGHRVIVVILNDNESQADGAKLLDWAFAGHQWP